MPHLKSLFRRRLDVEQLEARADTVDGDVARLLSRTPRGLTELVPRMPRNSPTTEEAEVIDRAMERSSGAPPVAPGSE